MRMRYLVNGFVALAASACASAGVSQETRASEAPARSRVFDRTPEVKVWLSGDRVLRRGDRVRAYVRADDGAYVMVFRVDTDGRITVLYPSDPRDDAFMRQGETRLASRYGRESFYVDDDYPGLGYVFAIASNEPFRTGQVSSAAGWEYSHIGDRTRAEPFTAMHDFARQMLSDPQSDYALDYVHYYVERRVRYSSNYDPYDFYNDGFHRDRWRYPLWAVYWPYFVIGADFRSCGHYWGRAYHDPFFNPCFGYYGGRGHYGYGGTRVVYVNESRIRSRFDFKVASPQRLAAAPGNIIDRRRRITDEDLRRPGSNNVSGVGGVGTGSVIGTGRRVRGVAGGPRRDGGEPDRFTEERTRVDNERDRIDVTRRYPGSGTGTPARDEPGDEQPRFPIDRPRRAPVDVPRREPRTEPRTEPRQEPRSEPRRETPRQEPRSAPRQEPRRDPGTASETRSEPRSDSRGTQPSAAPSRGVGRRTPGGN